MIRGAARFFYGRDDLFHTREKRFKNSTRSAGCGWPLVDGWPRHVFCVAPGIHISLAKYCIEKVLISKVFAVVGDGETGRRWNHSYYRYFIMYLAFALPFGIYEALYHSPQFRTVLHCR